MTKKKEKDLGKSFLEEFKQPGVHHPLWDSFVKWCVENGVDTRYTEDWMNWWNCYIQGAIDYAVESSIVCRKTK